MDPVTRAGQRALIITTLAVPVTGWAVHALTLHRRLAAERRDPLTGAQRRAAFERRAQRLLARHQKDSLLCLVDLDNFKRLNDTHGHAAGDAALAATGERLAHWAGPHGVVGRLGGDEFAVATRVDTRAGDHAMEERLEQLMGALHEPVPTEAGPLPVAASVGTAVPDYLGIRALPALLRGADVSMYRTKHSGRYGWAEIEDLQTPTVNGRRQGRPGTALERAA
ncbi:GGDEF domain-containing protein [Streptomyces sp. KS 21]|uniref:GGDEF domain-containing protein n=1 Tax=Streptomyces sp. KS 21 TaxID=2485150 RepID=UPI0010630A1E|nr:GGDEF domain-containing protein [Streptomyces sp. KS 21]TDU67066.1 diguanylate cyclase (GGDEF)-like protein [Streptomyces sp. KS 21]